MKKYVEIGVTATQQGLTKMQEKKILEIFFKIKTRHKKNIKLHHGDCIGGDKQIDALARYVKFEIAIHPPNNPSKRANCFKPGDELHPEKPYLVRNDDIVRNKLYYIGAPKDFKMPSNLRGQGTWSTIRKMDLAMQGCDRKELFYIVLGNGVVYHGLEDLR